MIRQITFAIETSSTNELSRFHGWTKHSLNDGDKIVHIPVPGIAELSVQARFTERLEQVGKDTLQDRMTIDDPLRFAHSWSLAIRYKRVTDVDRLIEVDCSENERNPVVDGKFTITPP